MPAATEKVVRALREAIVTMAAALATMGCALAIDPEPGPAILAIVLCISLSRSQLDRDRRGRLEAALTLPVVSFAALGVGLLLLSAPWLGATLFVVALSASIWLRRFGPLVRRGGSLIALPFVVILTTPYVPTTRVGPALAWLLPLIVALLALFWVTLLHLAARRWRWLPAADRAEHVGAAPARASSLRPIASARMAIQMAVALSASFVVGYVFFVDRWAWIVLTAFIVGSGNQGRLDVAYKSVLRIAGAATGTLLALGLAGHAATNDTATIGLILAAVFMGVWLRPLNYAWWALFVTLALALLQGFEGPSAGRILSLRLEEIVIGAAIGVAAAWFVWPVRSTGVLRVRLADALAALAEALDPATASRDPGRFVQAMKRIEGVAPAFRASRLLTRRRHDMHPADWIDALMASRPHAVALIERGDASGAIRQAVGAARKAMREPQDIGRALLNLRRAIG